MIVKIATYSSEDALVVDILHRLPTYLKQKGLGWRVCKEVGVGRTIADIVALDWPKQAAEPREPLNVLESVVLSRLRRGGSTRIDLLESICGVGRQGLRDGRLDRLASWGMLRFHRGGRVTLPETWQERIRVVALEAKLTRWKTALRQAGAYRKYADESYVVLPERYIARPLASRSLFDASGVGLLKVTAAALVEVIGAAPSRDHDWRREFVVSRLLHDAA
jgi:hypothetical protein